MNTKEEAVQAALKRADEFIREEYYPLLANENIGAEEAMAYIMTFIGVTTSSVFYTNAKSQLDAGTQLKEIKQAAFADAKQLQEMVLDQFNSWMEKDNQGGK